MLGVEEHMRLVLQQARLKQCRPQDNSFLPLSVVTACLLRQLPPGTAPPSGVLSFHQIDRLPMDVLAAKLDTLIQNDASKASALMQALLLYIKLSRELLTVCHAHLVNAIPTEDALGLVTETVVTALVPNFDVAPVSPETEGHVIGHETARMPTKVTNQPPIREVTTITPTPTTAPAPVAHAVDPSNIMKRAVSRDTGDGKAIVDIMRKFPTDKRVQTHGVRALKGTIRKSFTASSPPASPRGANKQRVAVPLHGATTNASDEDEDNDDDAANGTKGRRAQLAEAARESDRRRQLVEFVIDTMKRLPDEMALQRDGLFCLSEYANRSEFEHIAIITASGGIISVMDAMARLPDDEEAHIAGLSILAHPAIAEDSVVRVNPESRRLVLSTMRRFPLVEQIQGLSCLALANLSLRHDDSLFEIVQKGGLDLVVATMKRFRDSSLVQASGCWFMSIVSSKNRDMAASCLDAGALPVCEKARVLFHEEPKVHDHAVRAIHALLADVDPVAPSNALLDGPTHQCTLQ